VNFDIFHAYDVRGIYPEDLDEQACYEIAGCYAELFQPKTVVVGMDARLSSPPLKERIIEGLLDWGVDVIDIGEITSDMLYFAVGKYEYSGGIVVSASHNPGQYNGLKMVKEKAAAISSDTGLFEIRDRLKADPHRKPPAVPKGKRVAKNIVDDYLEHVLGFIDSSRIKPLKLVVDANFGYVSRNLDLLAKRLNLDLIRLHFEPDGTFPKGPPNPMLEQNRIEAKEAVLKNKVDLCATWDADADRVMFLDEKGRFIDGIYITALLAEIMLQKHSGAKIIFDPRVVWPAFDTVNRMGGVPIMAKAGHAFMKDRMRDENAVFAGELSAHYYFHENYYADNGLIPFLLVLEQLSTVDQPFSEIIEPYLKNHFVSGELNYKVKDSQAVLNRVKEKYNDKGQDDYTDGYSLEAEQWRFNLRLSNTEPLMRLNVEARDPAILKEIRDDLVGLITAD